MLHTFASHGTLSSEFHLEAKKFYDFERKRIRTILINVNADNARIEETYLQVSQIHKLSRV